MRMRSKQIYFHLLAGHQVLCYVFYMAFVPADDAILSRKEQNMFH